MTHGLRQVVEEALEDASRVTGFDPSELAVVSAENVTWPDGSLGCPRPGRMYTQALVGGHRVRIQARERLLDYHAGSQGTPFLCPEEFASDPIYDGPAVR